MPRLRTTAWFFLALALAVGHTLPHAVLAEEDDGYLTEEAPPEKEEKAEPSSAPKPAAPRKRRTGEKRKYFTDQSPRTDAGVFHVAATVGGNFYVEPIVNASKVPTGDYFKDFGFGVGVVFDYDYSELAENIPLGLRGMIGYKYILNSVHVVTFDGMARHMWRFSEKSSFGLGIGGSAAVWYRVEQTGVSTEEIIFLPSFIIEGGFDFNPFMVDMRILINRIKTDSSIYGAELYFGFRL